MKQARESLDVLSKAAIVEIKSFANPPRHVLTVMSAVAVVLGYDSETTWAQIKVLMKNAGAFIDMLKSVDIAAIEGT